MKFFSRKAQAQPAPAPAYVECRSWHGTAFHIRATADPTGLALCGYEPLDDQSPIAPASYAERAKHQHEGWHYCSPCGERFIVISMAAMAAEGAPIGG